MNLKDLQKIVEKNREVFQAITREGTYKEIWDVISTVNIDYCINELVKLKKRITTLQSKLPTPAEEKALGIVQQLTVLYAFRIHDIATN